MAVDSASILGSHRQTLRGISPRFDVEDIPSLSAVIQKEIDYWANVAGLNEMKTVFRKVLSLLAAANTASDENDVRNSLVWAMNDLHNYRDKFIFSDSPEAPFLTALYGISPETGNAALSFFHGGTDQAQGGSAAFSGLVAATLFRHPAFVTERLESELTAFAERRASSEKIQRQFEQSITRWREEYSAELTRHKEVIDTGQNEFAAVLRSSGETLSGVETDFRKRLEALESSFGEQMKLKKPVEYWDNLDSQYTRDGRWWILATVAATVALGAAMVWFVYRPPDLLKDPNFSFSGFKGALLIGAAVSMAVFLINLLSRLATSAFHLARDARERGRLTHVYLALAADKAIEAEERKIVLTSLFSRSDTGLLKGDTSAPAPVGLAAIVETLKPAK
jgi:hypothetical protein